MSINLKGDDFMKALQSAWLFIQDQVLGMKWLHAVIGIGTPACASYLVGCLGVVKSI